MVAVFALIGETFLQPRRQMRLVAALRLG